LKSSFKLAVIISLLVSAAHAGITVSAPVNSTSVSSPLHIVASATSTNPVTAMKIYVDNVAAFTVNANKIDTNLQVASGSRYIVIQSWDSTGAVQKSALTVNVAYSTITQPDTSAKSFVDIEQMTGWQSCDACAGIGGAGPQTPYSMTQNLSSPSMDGRAAEFWVGGSTPYSNALWWKQLGGNSAVSNFVYDLYFYVKDPTASQALEFDVNQSTGGRKWIFGTECNMTNTGQWRIWDTANVKWNTTGIPCTRPAAYQWHHLVWEFKREGDYTKFISVTLDGKKSYINRSYLSRPSGAYELNVAYQMDGNYNQTDYSTWLDKVKLTYW
jgi:mRNA-degrading endonuclease toxin of MazEF toxin-antitoxin module